LWQEYLLSFPHLTFPACPVLPETSSWFVQAFVSLTHYMSPECISTDLIYLRNSRIRAADGLRASFSTWVKKETQAELAGAVPGCTVDVRINSHQNLRLIIKNFGSRFRKLLNIHSYLSSYIYKFSYSNLEKKENSFDDVKHFSAWKKIRFWCGFWSHVDVK
jgi:hypothetical protein